MSAYIIVSGEPGGRNSQTVDLATGPFEDIAAADQFRDVLDRTVGGRHVVMPLRSVTPPSECETTRNAEATS